jgi:regulator of sigma E protease
VTTLLAFLFVLGVLVFVHELGHFVVARYHGVRVPIFSLGFGPKLVAFTRGDTEYRISLIPLGGYVRMAGEHPDDPRAGAADEFLSKTKWQRFQILFAGPLMNIITAVVVLAVVLWQGGASALEPPVVGRVLAGSPAEKVGIQEGDLIQSVNGDTVENWDQLFTAIGTKPDREITLEVQRGGQARQLTLRTTAEGRYEIGDIGVLPRVYPVIVQLEPGGVGQKAGLQPRDTVTAFDGHPVATQAQLIDRISKSPDRDVSITIQRGEQELSFQVRPRNEAGVGKLGVYLQNTMRSYMPTLPEAVKLSVERNIESSGLIVTTFVGIFTGETSVRQLQGPVGIAQLSGESAALGWVALFGLMAMLSINLAIINLMPMPVLDGGHILIMLLEGVSRHDFSLKTKERMQFAGVVLLMMLMVTVIYNDLTRVEWIERFMPWRQ